MSSTPEGFSLFLISLYVLFVRLGSLYTWLALRFDGNLSKIKSLLYAKA